MISISRMTDCSLLLNRWASSLPTAGCHQGKPILVTAVGPLFFKQPRLEFLALIYSKFKVISIASSIFPRFL